MDGHLEGELEEFSFGVWFAGRQGAKQARNALGVSAFGAEVQTS